MYLGRFGYVVVEACLYVKLQSSLVSNFSNSRADARAAMTGQQQLRSLDCLAYRGLREALPPNGVPAHLKLEGRRWSMLYLGKVAASNDTERT